MEKIRQKIISGEYPVNSKLPNEFDLSEQFDVSRVTLRKAIKGLADDGLVEKIQGVGTFVRQPQKVKRIVSSSAVESFSEIAEKEGFKASVEVVKVKEVETPSELKDVLESRRALFIERVHLVNEASLSEAKLLKKSIGFPLLLLQVCVEDENHQVVHAGQQYVISDRYEFHV